MGSTKQEEQLNACIVLNGKIYMLTHHVQLETSSIEVIVIVLSATEILHVMLLKWYDVAKSISNIIEWYVLCWLSLPTLNSSFKTTSNHLGIYILTNICLWPNSQ
jgi:hypothetical protein